MARGESEGRVRALQEARSSTLKRRTLPRVVGRVARSFGSDSYGVFSVAF
jgi:hypothetical protein